MWRINNYPSIHYFTLTVRLPLKKLENKLLSFHVSVFYSGRRRNRMPPCLGRVGWNEEKMIIVEKQNLIQDLFFEEIKKMFHRELTLIQELFIDSAKSSIIWSSTNSFLGTTGILGFSTVSLSPAKDLPVTLPLCCNIFIVESRSSTFSLFFLEIWIKFKKIQLKL